jgi:hypothetical protein
VTRAQLSLVGGSGSNETGPAPRAKVTPIERALKLSEQSGSWHINGVGFHAQFTHEGEARRFLARLKEQRK